MGSTRNGKQFNEQTLRALNIPERSVAMFVMKHHQVNPATKRPYTNKEIADHFGLKSAVTVSKTISKVWDAIDVLDAGVKSGAIVLQKLTPYQNVGQTGGALQTVPPQRVNLLQKVQTYDDAVQVGSIIGDVFGDAVVGLIQGFTRDDIPVDQRMTMGSKGAAVVAPFLIKVWSMWQESEKPRPMKRVNSRDYPIEGSDMTTGDMEL